MNASQRCPAVVLIGGQSRRMGETKALIAVGGVEIGRRVAKALGVESGRRVYAGGRSNTVADALGLPLIPDRLPGEGPLVGVLSALTELDSDVLTVACDLPLLDEETVNLFDAIEWTPEIHAAVALTDVRQPSLVRWRRTARTPIEALVESGERSLLAALDAIGAVDVPCSTRALHNANTPSDLRDLGDR